jgi:hypothetical protein
MPLPPSNQETLSPSEQLNMFIEARANSATPCQFLEAGLASPKTRDAGAQRAASLSLISIETARPRHIARCAWRAFHPQQPMIGRMFRYVELHDRLTSFLHDGIRSPLTYLCALGGWRNGTTGINWWRLPRAMSPSGTHYDTSGQKAEAVFDKPPAKELPGRHDSRRCAST